MNRKTNCDIELLRELKRAIEEAGFDADLIASLSPLQGPSPSGGRTASGLNKDALVELMGIVGNYNFNNLTSDQESELLNRLESSGLLFPGLVISQRV